MLCDIHKLMIQRDFWKLWLRNFFPLMAKVEKLVEKHSKEANIFNLT